MTRPAVRQHAEDVFRCALEGACISRHPHCFLSFVETSPSVADAHQSLERDEREGCCHRRYDDPRRTQTESMPNRPGLQAAGLRLVVEKAIHRHRHAPARRDSAAAWARSGWRTAGRDTPFERGTSPEICRPPSRRRALTGAAGPRSANLVGVSGTEFDPHARAAIKCPR